jgi:hypothetical protein
MTARTDGIVRFLNLALFVNQVTDALSIAGVSIVARAVGEPNGTRRVAEERVRKLMFLGEGSVLGHGVETDSQDFDVTSSEFVDLVAEPAAFNRSAGGIGFWVEP